MLQPTDADALAARFALSGPAELTGPVDRGELGQVWRLTTPTGRYAVKETFGPLDDAQITRVADLQERAAAAGIHTPRQLASADGDLAVRDFGSPVRIYPWVELGAPDRGLDPVAVGTMLAALHRAMPSVAASDEAVDPFFWRPVGARSWDELITASHRAGAPFADDLADWRTELITAESIMVEPRSELIISHRDLWADNVRLDAAGEITVVDWDNSGAASPSHELAMIIIEFALGQDGADRARTLEAAYRDAGGPGRVGAISDFTMPLAILGHLIELQARRWLEADGSGAAQVRERSEGWLAEYREDPLTLATVQGLSDALVSVSRVEG